MLTIIEIKYKRTSLNIILKIIDAILTATVIWVSPDTFLYKSSFELLKVGNVYWLTLPTFFICAGCNYIFFRNFLFPLIFIFIIYFQLFFNKV